MSGSAVQPHHLGRGLRLFGWVFFVVLGVGGLLGAGAYAADGKVLAGIALGVVVVLVAGAVAFALSVRPSEFDASRPA